MEIHVRPSRQVQYAVETTDVVVVSVTQHNRVGLGKIDSENLRVMQEQIALAGVEEDLLPVCFNPNGEPVFGPQAASIHCILRQDGQVYGRHGSDSSPSNRNTARATAVVQYPRWPRAVCVMLEARMISPLAL